MLLELNFVHAVSADRSWRRRHVERAHPRLVLLFSEKGKARPKTSHSIKQYTDLVSNVRTVHQRPGCFEIVQLLHQDICRIGPAMLAFQNTMMAISYDLRGKKMRCEISLTLIMGSSKVKSASDRCLMMATQACAARRHLAYDTPSL